MNEEKITVQIFKEDWEYINSLKVHERQAVSEVVKEMCNSIRRLENV